MTVGEITFDLGLGSSPFMVTIGDASGLAPLDLPEAFTMRLPSQDEQSLPKPAAEPSAGAVRRFETAMSNDASFGAADHPLRVFRNVATATSSADAVVVEKPIAVETPVVAETTTETVAKSSVHSVGTAPRTVRGGRGATALPVFATSFVAVEKPKPVTASVVIDPSVVVPTPVAVEQPVVAQTPVAVEEPVTVEQTVAARTPVAVETPVATIQAETTVVAPSQAEPAVIAPSADVSVATAETAIKGGYAINSFNSQSNNASEIAIAPVATSTVTPDIPTSATPVVTETPIVSEKPIAVESPVAAEKSIAVERPVAAETTTEAVAKSSVHSVGTAPRAVRGGRGATALPVFATTFMDVEKPKPVTASVVIDPSVVAKTPVVVEEPVMAKTPVVVEEQVMAQTPDAVEKPVATIQADSAVIAPVATSTVAPDITSTYESVVAEKPIAAEGPIAVEAPVAIEKPVVAEGSIAVETPVVAKTSDVAENPVLPQEHSAVGGVSREVLPLKPLGDSDEINVRPKEEIGDDEKIIATIQPTPVAVALPTDAPAAPVSPEVEAVSAAAARTMAVADTVDKIVDAIVGQIVVTPALTRGDGNVRIVLKPTVLDGSEISMTAKGGTLSVSIVPTTQEAERLASVALPRLETALAEHVSAFRHVSVAIVQKKGKSDETA